jgi:hypothetical protein
MAKLEQDKNASFKKLCARVHTHTPSCSARCELQGTDACDIINWKAKTTVTVSGFSLSAYIIIWQTK